MTVTLELTPEELATLTTHANMKGMDIETILHGLIALLGRHTTAEKRPAVEHTASMNDPEEQAERERESMEMQNNIRRWREEQGRETGSA